LKLKSNTKISIIVIIFAIISYLFLVNVDGYNFATQTSPVGFENIKTINISSTEVTIVGNTTIPVNCTIEYGTNGIFSNTASDNDSMNMLHTKHSVEILNLEPDTKYNYRFVVEYDDKTYSSDMGIFQTTQSDAPMSHGVES